MRRFELRRYIHLRFRTVSRGGARKWASARYLFIKELEDKRLCASPWRFNISLPLSLSFHAIRFPVLNPQIALRRPLIIGRDPRAYADAIFLFQRGFSCRFFYCKNLMRCYSLITYITIT